MSRKILDVKWTITATMAIVLLLSTSLSEMVAERIRPIIQRFDPVVTMSGVLISRTPNEAVIHISGTKYRECLYVSMQAYSIKNGLRHDAKKERLQFEDDGSSKPVGSYDLGLWRVWPIDGMHSTEMYVTHNCEGRLFTTQISDVRL